MTKYRSRRHRRRRTQQFVPIAIIAATVIAFGLLVYQAVQPRPGLAMPDLGNEHILYSQTATYNSSPPTSGPHYTTLARWGIHTEPIPNEFQVHNLEDGGVLIQYNCPEGCPDIVAELSEIVERYDELVILAPYPDMEARIALTAWTRLTTLDSVDEGRIVRFIEAYRGLDHHR